MNVTETLEQILKSYTAYYDIEKEPASSMFAAKAAFHSHDEQFFLVKNAKLGETESNEYVFFAAENCLDTDLLNTLDQAAWEEGISLVKPHSCHRNTDITLVIVSDRITPDAAALIPKRKHYKSYHWGFQGWSHYRLVVLEVSSGRAIYNRHGRELKKLFDSIIKSF